MFFASDGPIAEGLISEVRRVWRVSKQHAGPLQMGNRGCVVIYYLLDETGTVQSLLVQIRLFLRSHLYVLREKGDCKQITRNSPPHHAHQNSVQFRRNSEFYYFPLTVLESDLNPVLYKEDSYHNEGDKGSTALSIFSKLLRRTLICGSGSRLSE